MFQCKRYRTAKQIVRIAERMRVQRYCFFFNYASVLAKKMPIYVL